MPDLQLKHPKVEEEGGETNTVVSGVRQTAAGRSRQSLCWNGAEVLIKDHDVLRRWQEWSLRHGLPLPVGTQGKRWRCQAKSTRPEETNLSILATLSNITKINRPTL